MDDLLYKLWFLELRIKNLHKIEILKNEIGSKEFFELSAKEYTSFGIDFVKAMEIEKKKDLDEYRKVQEYISKENIELVFYNDFDYPESLKNIYNPPIGLYIKGKYNNSNPSVAIVGSRKASEYGKTAAFQMAYELGKRGITVISGLAKGIDSCAHRGCLESHGYTIGVMGSGFKNIYPADNRGLFKEIISSGCMITEYLPDMPPLQQNFPERNRIISGLSDFVLIVEAGERSGSLITAHLALEQGKDVFAVPGNIFSPNSKGTNKLIKDGAKPILDIEDILEEFNMSPVMSDVFNLDIKESKLIEILKSGAVSFDDLFERAGLEVEVLLSTISKLECTGIIKRVYGNYYMIN